MENKDMIEDIIAMLDNSVVNDVGHLNVSIDDMQKDAKSVETLGCMDCAKGNLACQVPTLHEGIDD